MVRMAFSSISSSSSMGISSSGACVRAPVVVSVARTALGRGGLCVRGAAAGAKFVRLPDGRKIAYTEFGCRGNDAQHSVIALHGMFSSRFGGLPGIKHSTLEEYGVRMISIDRQGYGQSDPHWDQTFYSSAQDLEFLMDELDLGQKVQLFGVSMGGAFCWAALRYIPHRISGVAMCCPVGNFWWEGMTEAERDAITSPQSTSGHLISSFCKVAPFPAIRMLTFISSVQILNTSSDLVTDDVSSPDAKLLHHPKVAEAFRRDREESLKHHLGFGLAKDYELFNKGWTFDVKDVSKVYKGPIHIWNGDQDSLVPLPLQQWVQRQLPEQVHLHELPGHGHLSWICMNDDAHHEVLSTIYPQLKYQPNDGMLVS